VERLRLITRADLPAGAQAAQLAHAVVAFHAEHPELAERWRTASNTLVLLAVRDEGALAQLLVRARRAGIPAAPFHEPDIEGALTAIALAPGAEARRLCRGLPLALATPQIATPTGAIETAA